MVVTVLMKLEFGGRSLEYTRTIGLKLLPNLIHLQNYFGSPRVQTWSLAVEEHFYVLLPLALLAYLYEGSRFYRCYSE
jgi:peptidoglycan/LPS O-acetylase OafA/YrhL